MKSCFHKGVCKHFNEDLSDPKGECAATEVCKFYVGMDWAELKKPQRGLSPKELKRHYRKRTKVKEEDIIDGEGPSKARFLKARKKLDVARRNDKLDENQVSAIDALKGISYKKLTVAQRQQLVDIADKL